MNLSIHLASTDERTAAWRNAHEVWGGGLDMEGFLARRQGSARHLRARWWVLTVEGVVTAGLGLQELAFDLRGRIVPGFGLGSVHTRPDARRQGHAERLCRHVIELQRRQGAGVGLLFSDIGQDYYGRMGFVPCASFNHTCANPTALAESGPRLRLTPIDPAARLDLLSAAWTRHGQRAPLTLARDLDYWRYSLIKEPDNRLFSISDDEGAEIGYARVQLDDEVVAPIEIALLDEGGDPEGRAAQHRDAALRAIAALGAPRLSTWIDPGAALGGHFEQKPRKGLTMIRVDERLGEDAQALAATFEVSGADYF